MAILLALIVLSLCFYRPILGYAILLQINLVRALISIDINNICFLCLNDQDILLGAIVPILGHFLILAKIGLAKKIIYKIDIFDLFFCCVTAIMLFSIIYSISTYDSIAYVSKFIFLGLPFYFSGKLILLNSNTKNNTIRMFFKYSIALALMFSLISLVLLIKYGSIPFRLTIPGVHPITFSQLIGIGVILSFLKYISKDGFLSFGKRFDRFNIAFLLVFLVVLILSKTRGVMLASIISILVYFSFFKIVVKKRFLKLISIISLAGLVALIFSLDFESIFNRILNASKDASIQERIELYSNSILTPLEKPIGIGAGAFEFYEKVGFYPHNLFLDLIVQFGFLGIILFLFLTLIILILVLDTYNNRLNKFKVVLFALLVYFLIETMFSFTFWMYKGVFAMLGLMSGFYYTKVGRDQ
ncbi:O-antigen ligase family protein [Flagellimonas crocea]|uniref:O-antigen ligase family protein n=1 Tax=Flagellimonas crocea TaxID=3067311 RepID=UPI00296EEE2A|nr:O-antigen ligase family protein [Muricauda sp. DH64]